MEEQIGPLGGDGGDSSRTSSSFVKKGDRQMFTVELRPAETTIVSWKKLMKDSNRVNGSTLAPEHLTSAHPALESRIAPGQPTENEANDGAFPHRFSAVIEKIERLYMGKDSSDEDDLLDVPDDDQYDTEDSFIDDAELDEYFEVDNSAIKHDGFFVNRGKLERINEPLVLPNQQPKKRRRKDILKNAGESYDGQESNKHEKVGKTAAGKAASIPVKKTLNSTQNLPVSIEHYDDFKFQSQLVSSSKKNMSDTKSVSDPAVSVNVSNDDTPPVVVEAKDIDKQNLGNLQCRNANDKYKDASGSFGAYQKKYHEKSSYAHSKSQPGRPTSGIDGVENRVQSKEKHGIFELPDLNLSEARTTMQATKLPYTHKKEGTSVRPKTSMLEKAIRELEKIVAESRPPAMENQEADTTSQAVKRRLPREIKLKLSKVARLAASHGKVSKELINRLMSILGHLIQLRTLKRHLKIMITMGLSAKQEKDARFQSIKKEVVDMIKMQAPSLEPKQQQQASASGDFQEFVPDGKASEKRMDTALEDKLCDLYDLFVDGLDDDAGPQIRKLYAELAELWPNGYMDNRGIKKAICRAKERRKALYMRRKDHEKVKSSKRVLPSQQEAGRYDPSSVASQQNVRERLTPESSIHAFASVSKPVSNTINTVGGSSPLVNGPKQEKVKGTSINLEDVRVADGVLTKKVKRKPESEFEGTDYRPEKLASAQGEERSKSSKQSASLSHKSNIQSTSLPGLEQSS
ncbi:ubinuclein-1 isoform X2 [Neltuma alba]|uniref:ubinuclein-1 isoform X2 n=1 Tax=Neltuma alba TaxID=207710 RepID=UPI0010A5287F|nr:ubinuclein-1-like isoform X2 [Prosopis alba]